MNEIKTIDNKGNISVTAYHTERKWFHKLFGINKPEPILGLTVNDFKITKSEIHCVVDNGNGYYEFYIAIDINITK